MVFSLAINDTDQPDSADEPDPSPLTAGFFRPDHDPPLLNLQPPITNYQLLFPLD
ncbi:MAG: hypothetical protein AABZ78_04945 [Chloroflexota bacterium]